jgi:hypothetical protein
VRALAPKRLFSALTAATLAVASIANAASAAPQRIVTTTTASTDVTQTFADVSPDDPLYGYVEEVYARGIMTGYTCGTLAELPCDSQNRPYFRPDLTVVRGQMAKAVSLAVGRLAVLPTSPTYSDVATTNIWFPYVEHLTYEGLVSGFDCAATKPCFKPFDTAERGQFAKLVAFAFAPGFAASGQTYEDVPPTNPFYAAVEDVTAHAWMSDYACDPAHGDPCVGPDNRPYFHPSGPLTRGEMARALSLVPLSARIDVRASDGSRSVQFGNVHVGTQSAAHDVTIYNVGRAPMGLGAITATPYSSDYSFDASLCGFGLDVGESCIVHATFTPSSGGNRDSSVSIVSTAINADTGSFSVHGAGVVGSDTTPPAVGATRLDITPSQTAGTTVLVTVSWPAATDTSGIGRYQLQERKGTGSWRNVTLATPTSRSVSVALAPATKYAFRLRATDVVGNTSAWQTSTGHRLTVLQETATPLSYVGSWQHATATGAFGGSVKFAQTNGAIARLSSAGSSVALVSTRSPARGLAEIWVDGSKLAGVDLYSTSTSTRSVVWSSTGWNSVPRRIELHVLGAKNAASSSNRVDLDAILILT